MEHTVEDFLEYVKGWLGADSVKTNSLDMNAMKAALKNSLNMLEDYQDGIDSYVERKGYSPFDDPPEYHESFA